MRTWPPHAAVPGLLISLLLVGAAKPALADAPGPVRSLAIETVPAAAQGFTLAGRDAGLQLVVTGRHADDAARDLTRAVTYEAQPPGIVVVDATGWVAAVGEGQA